MHYQRTKERKKEIRKKEGKKKEKKEERKSEKDSPNPLSLYFKAEQSWDCQNGMRGYQAHEQPSDTWITPYRNTAIDRSCILKVSSLKFSDV